MMKALTVLQPWATPIARGWKKIENRKWAPPMVQYGADFAIHAGANARSGRDYLADLSRVRELVKVPKLDELLEADAGKVVAVVTMHTVVEKRRELAAQDQLWFVGPYGWVLTQCRRLPKPVAVRGQQGLWYLPADVERQVRAQL